VVGEGPAGADGILEHHRPEDAEEA
jgi:hypothetical protein